MIVCVCKRVSDRDIARAVRAGCQSFLDLQRHLGAATGCGACASHIRSTLERHRRGGTEQGDTTLGADRLIDGAVPVASPT